MILIKEMLKRTCYGFAFGTGVGVSMHISPKYVTEIWPEQAIASIFTNKETKETKKPN